MTKKSQDRLIRDTMAVRLFHELYEKCIGIAGGAGAGYELAERIHKNRTGKRFYKNWQSFRNSRKHYLTHIKGKKK
jgi:hypothetical protein